MWYFVCCCWFGYDVFMVCFLEIYGNLSFNPLFFPFRRYVLFDNDKLLLSQAPKCCVSKLFCHPKSVQVECLGLRNQLELLWKLQWPLGWSRVKTCENYSWMVKLLQEWLYRFIHPITDEIPMITGLVFHGKMFNRKPPYWLVKTMVSGEDFPKKTNPIPMKSWDVMMAWLPLGWPMPSNVMAQPVPGARFSTVRGSPSQSYGTGHERVDSRCQVWPLFLLKTDGIP